MFENLEKYKSLEFFARQVMEGFITGLHKSPFHGFSVEFSEHRLYNPGESTRNIDWKLYGRTDKLFVKRFEEETNLRCQIMIDHSGSMMFPHENQNNFEHPNKLTFAIYAAAVLTEMFVRQRDAFGLTLFGENIDIQTDTRSNILHQHYIFSILEQELQHKLQTNVQPSTTNIADALHITAEKLKRRSLVIIFTDAFVNPQQRDALLDALRHLRHCKHEVLLFHTYDQQHELNFEYDNRPTEFIDLESGKKLKVQPAQVAELYKAELKRQTKEIKQRAIQYRIDYIPINIQDGFEAVLLPYLLKRSKLH